MSTKQKLIERFMRQPTDFTWDELEYKGYVGSIEYNKDDNCFHGQVLGLNKKVGIIYEGFTAEELYHDFKDGIDHYLEFCKEDGIQPEKPYNGIFINERQLELV